ncbi:MAG: hypothetical protein ABJA74_02335 [Lapillicoccus sp.]
MTVQGKVLGQLWAGATDAVMRRRPGGLPRWHTLAGYGPVLLTLGSLVVLVDILVSGTRFAERPVADRLVAISLILGSAASGLGLYAATRPPDESLTVSGWGRRLRTGGSRTARMLLTGAALSILALPLLRLPVGAGRQGPDLLAVALWMALFLSVLFLTRRRDPTVAPVDVARLAAMVAPAVLVVAAAWVVMVAEVGDVPGLVDTQLLLLACAAVVVVPTVVVSGAVEGVARTGSRGELLVTRTRSAPGFVIAVIAVKLVLALAVYLWGLAHDPVVTLVGASGAAWAGALVGATMMLALLVLDRRVVLARSHREAVSRVTGFVVGLPLTLLVAIPVALVLLGSALGRPRTVAALAAVIGVGYLSGRVTGVPRRVLLGIGLFAALGGVWVAGSDTPTEAAANVSSWASSFLAWGGIIPALLGIAVLLVLAVVVVAVVRRRFRPLVYLVAIAVWLVWANLTPPRAPGLTMVNVDIAFGVLLLMAALAWAFLGQREIDGYEVVLAAVVTSAIIEAPIIASLLPDSVGTLILAAALGGPAVVTLWSAIPLLRAPETATSGFTAIGVCCLCYSAMAAFVYWGGITSGRTLNDLSTTLIGTFAVPVALILVAVRSAARTSTR